jgi:hypothetical protein
MDPAKTPALEPPPGVEPDFVNPTSYQTELVIIMAFTFTVPTICVISRLYTKVFLLHVTHIDDWLCYLGWALFVAYGGILIHAGNQGLGRHQWDVSVTMLSKIAYWISMLYCIYAPMTLVAKLSVLFQIKRIFTTHTRDMIWWVVMISIVANVLCYTGILLTQIMQCIP